MKSNLQHVAKPEAQKKGTRSDQLFFVNSSHIKTVQGCDLRAKGSGRIISLCGRKAV